jgi:Ca-activated chloride channel homolog
VVTWWITAAVVAACMLSEWLHARRCRRLAYLAFGPAGRPRAWVAAAAPLRVAAAGALCWGLIVLLGTDRAPWNPGDLSADKAVSVRHLMIALDVSPSMQLADAGPAGVQRRAERARDVVRSILDRIDLGRTRVSVIAFYTEARPVVIDTFDPEVVANILDDLPLEHAFTPGKTNMYEGVKAAGAAGKAWPAKSATLLVVSDGDTLPAKESPALPPAFGGSLVLGVGNPYHGLYIDGHSSRQDGDSLRQLALRLGGQYFDTNQRHVPSVDLVALDRWLPVNPRSDIGLREAALASTLGGASALAALCIALTLAGGLRSAPTVQNGKSAHHSQADETPTRSASEGVESAGPHPSLALRASVAPEPALPTSPSPPTPLPKGEGRFLGDRP